MGNPQDDESLLITTIHVDDKLVFDSKANRLDLTGVSRTTKSPHRQADMRFDKPTEEYGRHSEFVVQFDLDDQSKQQKAGFWVWLSSTPH